MLAQSPQVAYPSRAIQEELEEEVPTTAPLLHPAVRGGGEQRVGAGPHENCGYGAGVGPELLQQAPSIPAPHLKREEIDDTQSKRLSLFQNVYSLGTYSTESFLHKTWLTFFFLAPLYSLPFIPVQTQSCRPYRGTSAPSQATHSAEYPDRGP